MSKGGMKLQLGCFDQVVPGWVNTDISPHIWVARVPGLASALHGLGILSERRFEQHAQGVFRGVKYLNVARRFPYSDGSVDCVYSSHLLEHLYSEQAFFCLSEVQRVLRVGGVVRIAVPDLDHIVQSYNPADPNPFLEAVFEAMQKGDKNRHHWHYNETTLGHLLRLVGFQEISRCAF